MNDCVLGFNGERRDPISGTTHSGNGYRAYNPTLMRFNCPDSWSPFGAGGINPYAYCADDPVNQADPSGHFSLGQGIGMALGFVAGVALSILTGGAAMPVALTLMATVAGDAAIGAGTEFATEAIDGQRISWRQVGIAALVGAGVGKGGSKVYGALKEGFTRMTRCLVASDGVISLGGVRSLHGINADYGYFTFTDTYAGKLRFNIVGHGTEDSAGHISLGPRSLSALTLADHLKTLMPNNTQFVRLAMCRSADGGPFSFAQSLANALPLPVKGYCGDVGIKKPFLGVLKKLNSLATSPPALQAWREAITDASGLPFLEKIKWNYAPKWFYPQNTERTWRNPAAFMSPDLLKNL